MASGGQPGSFWFCGVPAVFCSSLVGLVWSGVGVLESDLIRPEITETRPRGWTTITNGAMFPTNYESQVSAESACP